jgi:flagellar biosynthetic protein FliS
MDDRLRHFYLESRVKNASCGQLLIMLYDALVENAELAESELAAAPGTEERNRAPIRVGRCIDIITELSTSLRHEVDRDLCSTLGNLYAFFARQFADALRDSDPARVGAILPLLRELNVTWIRAEKISAQAQLVAAAA